MQNCFDVHFSALQCSALHYIGPSRAFWLCFCSLLFCSALFCAALPQTHPLPLLLSAGQQLAVEEDFVSFKLDIDTPSVEIPIALALAQDPYSIRLVDEFFFELHFQCELNRYCGWGKRVPKEFMGQPLDRPATLKLFSNMRRHGIRAHIWP